MSNSHFNHVSHVPMATAVSQSDSGLETHALKNRTGNQSDLPEKNVVVEDDEESISSGPEKPVYDHTHRQLKPRHVQLIGMLVRNIYDYMQHIRHNQQIDADGMLQVLAGRLARSCTSRSAKLYRKEALAVYS